MRRVAVVAACALALAALVTVAVVRTADAENLAPSPVGGMQTCVYSQNRLDRLQAFEKLVGRPLSCALIFNDAADTWQQLEDAWFVSPGAAPNLAWDAWVKQDPRHRTLVITQAMTPKQVPPNWRSLAAIGAYDEDARRLARTYVAAGLGSSVIRLAHEANGDWYTDNIGTTAQDHAQWAAAWRHFATAMKSVKGAHFTFDWTVNPGYRAVPLEDYYPGDDVVDVVGMDIYDDAPSSVGTKQPARWQFQWSRTLGIGAVADFARRHGKPLSIPEWGLRSAGSTGAGDDGTFVDQVAALVEARRVTYNSYFEAPTEGTLTLDAAPTGLARWKAAFGNGG